MKSLRLVFFVIFGQIVLSRAVNRTMKKMKRVDAGSMAVNVTSKGKMNKSKGVNGFGKEETVGKVGNITDCIGNFNFECESFDSVGFCCRPR